MRAPDVEAPGVDVDQRGLDVDGLRPHGEPLRQDLDDVRLEVDGGGGGVESTGARADQAGCVVDADGLRATHTPLVYACIYAFFLPGAFIQSRSTWKGTLNACLPCILYGQGSSLRATADASSLPRNVKAAKKDGFC